MYQCAGRLAECWSRSASASSFKSAFGDRMHVASLLALATMKSARRQNSVASIPCCMHIRPCVPSPMTQRRSHIATTRSASFPRLPVSLGNPSFVHDRRHRHRRRHSRSCRMSLSWPQLPLICTFIPLSHAANLFNLQQQARQSISMIVVSVIIRYVGYHYNYSIHIHTHNARPPTPFAYQCNDAGRHAQERYRPTDTYTHMDGYR